MRKSTAAGLALATVGVLGVGAVASAAPGDGNGAWGRGSAGAGSRPGVACQGGAGGAGGAAMGLGNGRRGGWGRGGTGRAAGAGSQRAPQLPAAVPGTSISAAVSRQLVYIVQEEQLARDVYRLAAAKYPDRVFTNIAASESTHMAAVRALLDRYDVADPTVGAQAGEFADTDLQGLYDKLAEQVASGRDDAIQAGITVERTDIDDLREALALEAPADVDTVLGNLLEASGRHLAAFQRNA